ncbi:Uncharacterised protein [Klebsiella pneumoniae]|uniref:Host cell division inhibitor Icd-like protein n=2 Tax=root TaxID=1 RepID=A0A8S5T780_9CAUD|nr:Uncharacterised protein [Klebsiella pneumoniae]DAF59204.1 MAG TPA: hypothetical protein [Myoviridae sp. ctZhr26]
MILHNSIRVAQNLSRRNSHAQIKLGDMPSLNNRVRLTYGHRNPLNQFDYNEPLELASNKHEQYSGSPEHQHCLGSAIIFKGCIKENQQRAVEVPTNNVESCNGSAFLLYEGNQQRTVLYRNPNLAYERVVPQSHQVNHAAKRYAENKPSLRGGVQRLCGSLCPAQNNPEIIGAVHSITGSNPVQPFGSMPCRKSSLRARAFSQLPRLTPSRLAASFSCWRSSGVMRIWKVGDKPSPFGVLSLLIVDMYVRNLLLWILLCTYVITAHVTKATPRSAGTLPRRLTTNVNRSNAMAMPQCNQTHPKNRVFIFLALNRADMQSRPHREVITAVSEREARKLLVGRFILVFAGRLPAKEIYHG